jgi:hypothetical protein
MLQTGSAIAPDVIAESGARTINKPRELSHGFSQRQRRRVPGILFAVHRPNGQKSWCFRPDRTDPDNPGHRYEQQCKALGGAGNVLGVLPSHRHLIADTRVPVVFVEGIKKALALTSAARKAGVDLLVVAILGVWNWLSDGEPIPDMADIPLEGRNATVTFDSDMVRNPDVMEATKRLAEHAEGRGAKAFVTYLEDAPDGSKVGADDFFVAGGTLAQLWMLTRRYDPADFKQVRLSRDQRLCAMLGDLQRTYAAMPAAQVGECSRRAIMRELLVLVEQSGKPTDRGVIVRAPLRPLAVKARLSLEAVRKALRWLEEAGLLERVEEPKRKTERRGAAYLLYAAQCTERALGRQYGTTTQGSSKGQEQSAEREAHRNADSYAGVSPARAPSAAVPELRHSKVVHTWARRDGRRVVVDSDYVYRIAKQRQEVLMYLLENGGEAPEAELLERFGSKRTRLRDFRKRKLSPLIGWRYSRDKETGGERRLEVGPPLVSCEGGVVRILPEWREALEEHRKQTGELEDNERQAERYKRQSEAYRNRARRPADKPPSPLRGKEEMSRLVEERRKEEKARWVEEQRQKVGITAATFLADELEGIAGVRFSDVRQRWAARGGSTEELRRAVMYGPWRFTREADGDLYVYPEDLEGRAPGPNERMWREREQERERSPVEVEPEHPWHCDCPDCGPEPSYARPWSASS